MTTEQALEFLNQIAEVVYKQGQVQVTPEAHERLREAIKVLEK